MFSETSHRVKGHVSFTFINPEHKTGEYWTEGIDKDVCFHKTPIFTQKCILTIFYIKQVQKNLNVKELDRGGWKDIPGSASDLWV